MTAFASLLVESGVQPADLEKAQAYQQKYGGRLEQILVNMGGLASEALPQIYSKLLSLEVLSAQTVAKWDPPETIDDYPLERLVAHALHKSNQQLRARATPLHTRRKRRPLGHWRSVE